MLKILIDSERAEMVTTALNKLADIGVVIVSITTDNPTVNWKMFELLGADLNRPSPKVSLHLNNCLKVPIFVSLDACHLIKLIRNAFGDCGTFLSPEGSLIQWQYLVELNKLQNKKKLHLATKLRDAHIDYSSNKMKVYLATQTLSKSNAIALNLWLLSNSKLYIVL